MSRIRDQIMDEIARVPDTRLTPLVEIIRAYRLEPNREPAPLTGGQRVARHAGALTDQDATEMLAFIEDDCERIDFSTW